MFKKSSNQSKTNSSKLYRTRTTKLIRSYVVRLLLAYPVLNMISFSIVDRIIGIRPFRFTCYVTDYPAIHLLTIALAVVLSAYLAFYRKNITIEVTDKAIRFMRGGSLQKEYLHLPFADYEFTSHVVREVWTPTGKRGGSRFCGRLINPAGKSSPIDAIF